MRPFLSVFFACCRVYQRIYRNAAASAYVGWCPRCASQVRIQIGPNGSGCRTFRAG